MPGVGGEKGNIRAEVANQKKTRLNLEGRQWSETVPGCGAKG